MKSEREEKLREVLRSWNEQQQPSRSLAELQERIRSASQEHEERVSDSEGGSFVRERPSRWRGALGRERIYVAVAASLLVVLVGGWRWVMEGSGGGRNRQQTQSGGMDKQDAVAERAERGERALEPSPWSDPKLAAEWISHFENRLEWMAEDADRVWVKTSDRGVLDGDCYALRLELYATRGEGGSGGAKAHWAMDFLIEDQSQVEIGGDESSRRVMVWPHRLDDGQVVLEVEFSDGDEMERRQAWTSIIPLDGTGYGGKVQRMGDWELRQSLVVMDASRLM